MAEQSNIIEDGFGSEWMLCDRTDRSCGLEIVRPGKVQCWCDYEDADGNCIHSRTVGDIDGVVCSDCNVRVSD